MIKMLTEFKNDGVTRSGNTVDHFRSPQAIFVHLESKFKQTPTRSRLKSTVNVRVRGVESEIIASRSCRIITLFANEKQEAKIKAKRFSARHFCTWDI